MRVSGVPSEPNPLFILSLTSLEISDTKGYAPQIRARLETAAHFCGVVVLELSQRCGRACA